MRGARPRISEGYKPKDLVLVGPLLATALQRDGWFLRNEIIWHKKGVRPENVNDRFSRTHEKLFLLTKASSYRFDQDTMREPVVTKAKGGAGSRASELPRRLLRVGARSGFGPRIRLAAMGEMSGKSQPQASKGTIQRSFRWSLFVVA